MVVMPHLAWCAVCRIRVAGASGRCAVCMGCSCCLDDTGAVAVPDPDCRQHAERESA